jgi:SAM-dependent methyltransferase
MRDILDVYCGARPYEPLFPSGVRYVGLDIDDAYGCADVVTDAFLPFPDASFDLCLCTQAFYFVADVPAAVAEFERVLRRGGKVLLTVPVVYPGTKIRYTEAQLRALFANWTDVVVVENGLTVVSIVTLIGYLLLQVQKRVPRLFRPGFAVVYLLLNLTGAGAERIERRYLGTVNTTPANLLIRATRP